MAKALKFVLIVSVASVAVLASAEQKVKTVGCVKTAKACTCYRPSGRPMEVEPDACESKFQPLAVMTVEGGDVSALVTPVKRPPSVPENEPYRPSPVPWLIER